MKYVRDHELEAVLVRLIRDLELNYINPENIRVVRSKGSHSVGTVARIHGLPKCVQVGLGLEPSYVIEVIDEKFSPLNKKQKIRVLIHELLHIPSNFGGGVLAHSRKNFLKLEELYFSKLEDILDLYQL
ncbi:MAG: putative metallopeptidase [Thermoproteota archaeon]